MRTFIAGLPDPKSTPATIININSTSAYTVIPGMHGYGTAKLALLQFGAHLTSMYPSVNVVAVNPGFVDTDALLPMFRSFSLDTVELTGGVCVWLARDPARARFLSGRFITANWDVDELVARKDEIVDGGKLMVNLVGTFGKEQFGE
jgi:NAD(P)-dependent dehydrogenase (short-subunit alcohol dehydrogenase family)